MAKKRKTKAAKPAKTKKQSTKSPQKQSSMKKDSIEALTTGCPQKVASKADGGNFSTHKARAGWFNAREAWPMREAPLELLMRARNVAKVNLATSPGTASWEESGPTNIGGRMTSIAVDASDADRIWVGAAGGGVWTSTDGGLHWTPRWHDEPTLNIGSICLDPSNPDILYCGTGEANLSADSHPGVGMYRSMDGGTSWHLLAPANTHGLPRRIGRVVVDPFDSDHILIGGVGHQSQDARGLFVSTDAGNSWARINAMIPSPYHCHEAIFHPTKQGTIYVTIDANGSQSGIWKTEDSGQNWTHLTSGLSAPALGRRIGLAIALSDPKILYAQVATATGQVRGVFRTANGGNTWKSIGGTHFNNERQMNYNNTISVNPNDADVVLCGGVDLHRTKSGGTTWKKVTDWRARRGVDQDYSHADQHLITHSVAQSGLIYAMNDGGMDVSTDGGDTWENRSNGLSTNMFYDLSVAASDGNMYGGGFQDNGTWMTLTGEADKFVELTGGDGGFCAIDPNDRLHLYTSSQRMRINRFKSPTGWMQNIGPNETGPRPWMAFIALDPSNTKRVFVTSQRVWRTKNNASSWSDVSGNLDGSFISCVEISRANTNCIYVGTENGGIFRSSDGGDTWSGNISSSALPGRTVTRLRTPADDEDVIYATVANFGSSHLFRSVDGGDTWQDVDSGNLPDAPLHAIVIPSDDSESLFVGGDAGVFVSRDAGDSWSNLSLNLPTVMIVDLVLHEATDKLIAATYGRSTWRLDLSLLP